MRDAHIIVDLGFGDSGKGTMTDALCRLYGADIVIRFCGAGQAAHNVVTADGRHHTFSHYGSGALAGVATHLSQFMYVEPLALDVERGELAKVGGNLSLSMDPRCVVITPYHRYLNQAWESVQHHGSVGIGFGMARMGADEGVALRVRTVIGPAIGLHSSLYRIRTWAESKLDGLPAEVREHSRSLMRSVDVARLADEYRGIVARDVRISTDEAVAGAYYVGVFEGAQGVLLDETHGFRPPHTSWSNCTFDNAMEMLQATGAAIERVGVIRSYYTRHGAGPFPSEAPVHGAIEKHNGTHEWMGAFRTGHFDQHLFDYAVSVCGGIDSLALTHADIPFTGQVCVAHDGDQPLYRDGVPNLNPKYVSWGPRSDQKEACKAEAA